MSHHRSGRHGKNGLPFRDLDPEGMARSLHTALTWLRKRVLICLEKMKRVRPERYDHVAAVLSARLHALADEIQTNS